MTRLQIALGEIENARKYTLMVLQRVPSEDWFRQPQGITHIAWQVGHLAVAEYGLTLLRLRGPDEALMPEAFRKQFGKDSQPQADPAQNPTPEELRALLDRVHQRVLSDLHEVPDAELDLPPLVPHKLCQTRLDSLFWCARHEMVHAGQIGLLRRLLGHEPMW